MWAEEQQPHWLALLRPVPQLYLISSWSKLSKSRPERSAMERVLLNFPRDASLIFACIFAWAIALNDDCDQRGEVFPVWSPADCPVPPAPQGNVSLNGLWLPALASQKIPEENREQWFPICGPRTLKAQNDELQLFNVNSLDSLFGLDVTPPSNYVIQGNSH